MDIENLVARIFAIRNASHLAHWGTLSYAQHMALGDFYDDIIESVDEIVEIYQGLFGLIGEVPTLQFSKDDIQKQIVTTMAWIEANRSSICRGQSMLENKVDELTAIFARTHYKLRFLQ